MAQEVAGSRPVTHPTPYLHDLGVTCLWLLPARLYAPVIMDPVYGYASINVEAQERSPFSLLHWMKRLIALRRQYPGSSSRPS